MPAAFQVGGLDLRPLQELAAAAGERDGAVDHDVAAVRQFQRVEGILLDQKHRELSAR